MASWCRASVGVLLIALLACGDGAPGERVVLLDYDFGNLNFDPTYGLLLDDRIGLHEFTEGWAVPRGEALWALGPRSTIRLTLLGTEVRLRARLSTDPRLARRGQIVRFSLNGELIREHRLRDHWQVDTLTVQFPDELVVQGINRLDIEPSEFLSKQDHEPSEYAVYVWDLKVESALDRRQLREWQDMLDAPATESARAQVRIPPMDADVGLTGGIRSGEARPDVLMILLDAARADHFSCYGYRRATTPNIDTLAAEGILFENLFAEAPYTRSSVSTLFSAHSWRDHGVVGREHALGPSFTTLAELFRNAGYHTLAISDNANVARSSTLDRGFDEFVQTWTDVRIKAPAGSEKWWPELPEKIFDSRLDQGLEDRPTFFYVHLMPPHEPYYPGNEHDVFGPEGYDGPITGHPLNVQDFDRGRYALGSADHARLIALYDGSLRRGDAMVGRIVERWRALGRTRPLLTVILSDHGEGLGEHQRFSHSSTPYDEMLHVPFILHPSELVPESLRKSPDALRSLGDVLPLLLHTLQITLPPGSAWPRRVLEVLEDPARPRELNFIRCSQPLFGIRRPSTLSVLRTWSRQEYYDLSEDPGAQNNLRPIEPDRYLRDVHALRAFLEHPPALDGPTEAELSPEDIERLRALGYM